MLLPRPELLQASSRRGGAGAVVVEQQRAAAPAPTQQLQLTVAAEEKEGGSAPQAIAVPGGPDGNPFLHALQEQPAAGRQPSRPCT